MNQTQIPLPTHIFDQILAIANTTLVSLYTQRFMNNNPPPNPISTCIQTDNVGWANTSHCFHIMFERYICSSIHTTGKTREVGLINIEPLVVHENKLTFFLAADAIRGYP